MRIETTKVMKRMGIALAVSGLMAGVAWAGPDEISETGARYETMLERQPKRGTAFEKVYLEFLEAGRLDELRERWSARAEASPSYVLLLGYLDERREKLDEARAAFARYAEQAPDAPEGWEALAGLDHRAGRLAEAAAARRKALERTTDPERRIALYQELALELERQFLTEEATVVWRELAEEFADETLVLEEVSLALAQAGKTTEAREMLEGLAAKPELDAFQRVGIEARIAGLEELEGKTKQARERYDGLLASTRPGSWLHRDLRARIEASYRREDDLPGLVTYYEGRLEALPQDVESAIRLAEALRELRREGEALDWLKRAAEWAPDREELQIAYAEALMGAGNFPDAIVIWKRLIRENPETVDFRESLGETHWRAHEVASNAGGDGTKDRAAAIEAWRGMAPSDGNDLARVVALATVWESHDLTAEARTEYERALAIDPRASDVRERLAMLDLADGEKERAWAMMDGIVPVDGAEVRDYLYLSRLQQRVERTEASLATVESGLKNFPGDVDLLQQKLTLASASERWDTALAVCDELLAGAESAATAAEYEKRKVRILVAMDRAEVVAAELGARIGAEPGLSESELRLLIRLLEATPSEEDAMEAALAEAEARFPDSVGLIELRIAALEAVERTAEKIALLRRMAELDPSRRSAWLREVARIEFETLDDEGEAALATLRESVEASPADVETLVGAADLAGRNDRISDAETWYREASRLAERPADALLRLGSLFMGADRSDEAITVFEEAFEAETESQGKLGIIKQMTRAYLQGGRATEIIDRFERRQRAEGEGGWRYALYLSEIYFQISDYSAAREELERALASRPKDASLLRQLVAVAEREQNYEQVEKFQRLLADVEPGESTELELASTLLQNGNFADARPLLVENWDALTTRAGLLQSLLASAKTGATVEPFLAMIDARMAGDEAGLESRQRRLEIALVTEDPEASRKRALDLWRDLQSEKLSPPSVDPNGPRSSPSPIFAYLGMTVSEESQALAMALQVRQMTASAVESMFRENQSRGSGSYLQSQFASMGKIAETYPGEVALAWYAALTDQVGDTKTAAAELAAKLAAGGASAGELLTAMVVMRDPDQLNEAVRGVIAANPAGGTLDRFALGLLAWRGAGYSLDPELVRQLLARTGTDEPEWTNAPAARAQAWLDVGEPERARSLTAEWAKNDPLEGDGEISAVLTTALRVDSVEAYETVLRRYAEKIAADPSLGVSYSRLSAFTMPGAVYHYSGGEPERMGPEDVSEYRRAGLRFLLQTHDASAGAASGSSSFYGEFRPLTDAGAFVPTKLLGLPDLSVIDNTVRNALRQGGKIDDWIATIEGLRDDVGADAPDDERDRLDLILAILQASDRRMEPALATIRELREKRDDPALDVVEAKMLMDDGDERAALELLDAVPRSAGDVRRYADLYRLDALTRLGERDDAEKLLSELTRGRRVTASGERNFLQNFERRLKGATTTTQPSPSQTVAQEAQSLAALKKDGKLDDANRLAEKLLRLDPFGGGNNSYAIGRAMSFLEKEDLQKYQAEWREVLDRSPRSARHLYLMARSWQYVSVVKRAWVERTDVELPVWLRLSRTGSELTAESSKDGETWKALSGMTFDADGPVLVGIAISSHDPKLPTAADFEAVALTGDAPASEGKGELVDGWRSVDVGKVAAGGGAEIADGSVSIRSAGDDIAEGKDSFRYVYRNLPSDGTITAKVTRIDPGHDWAKAGLMVRESLEPLSRFGMALVTPSKRVLFQARETVDGKEPVPELEYWAKLVEVRASDDDVRRSYARALRKAGREDESLAVLDEMLKRDPLEAMRNSHDLIRAYESADRLGDLVAFVEGYDLSRPDQQRDYRVADFVSNLAEKMGSKDPKKAVAFVSGVIERISPTETAEMRVARAKIQIAHGTEEEKRAALRDLILPTFGEGTAASAVEPTVYRRSLNNSIRHGDYDFEPSGAEYLGLLRENGMLEEIADALEAEEGSGHGSQQADPIRLAILAAANREAALPEIAEAIRRERVGMNGFQSRSDFLLVMPELMEWPEGRSLAVEWARQAARSPASGSSETQRASLPARLMILAAELAGDEEAVREGLTLGAKSLIVEITLDNEIDSRNGHTCLVVLNGLFARGMKEEAAELVKAMEPFAKDAYGPLTASAFQAEVAFDAGGTGLVAKAWVRPGGDGAEYELAPTAGEWKILAANGQALMGRRPQVPAVEGVVELLAGPDADELELFATIKEPSVRGTWEGRLPEGTRFLQARFVPAEGDPTSVKPVAVSRAENLFPAEIEWKGTQKGSKTWTLAGGVEPTGSYQAWFTGGTNDQLRAEGPRAEIDPTGTYLLSGWIRGYTTTEERAMLGVRFLDRDGKEIGAEIPGTPRILHWNQVNLVLGGSAGGIPIPENARFVEPLLRGVYRVDSAELFLGKW